MMKKKALLKAFILPIIVLGGLILFLLADALQMRMLALLIVFPTMAIGSYDLLVDSYESIKARQFGLDYIAILALLVAIITGEYLVGAVIALMLATGRTLEKYGASQARHSLSALADRIPNEVLVESGSTSSKQKIDSITIGSIIVLRKGEVIPLDGQLLSEMTVVDESSLTGEAYPVDKITGDILRSGTINIGGPIRLQVTNEEKDSSYTKIISLVRNAQNEKAPMIRLADKYSLWFSIVTLVISGIAYWHIGTLDSVLAVLVVATPCPLILATPIALIGGMNKAAKKRTIIKKLASIEVLSRVNAIIFDKTGTITLGKPQVTEFIIHDHSSNREQLLAIAEAIERNSLHPLAKAVVTYAQSNHAKNIHADAIHEEIGRGISGTINKTIYTLTKMPATEEVTMAIGLYQEKKLLAQFTFSDELKTNSHKVLQTLNKQGIQLAMFTGDKKNVAEKLIESLQLPVTLKAECKPEDKKTGIEALKKAGKVTAMVGDGINDAPALAFADVGMVFSNEEQTAASEAADIVFLGGNLDAVLDATSNARRTIAIAKQSIFVGIGMSIGCMVLAAMGLIPPVIGAGMQEVIDVIAIVNALRASR